MVGLAVDFHEAFETGAHHAEGCPAFPGQRMDARIPGVRVPKKRRRHGFPGGHGAGLAFKRNIDQSGVLRRGL